MPRARKQPEAVVQPEHPIEQLTEAVRSLVDKVEEMTQRVDTLTDRDQTLASAIDDARAEFEWAVRNAALRCSPAPVRVTSLPKDPRDPLEVEDFVEGEKLCCESPHLQWQGERSNASVECVSCGFVLLCDGGQLADWHDPEQIAAEQAMLAEEQRLRDGSARASPQHVSEQRELWE